MSRVIAGVLFAMVSVAFASPAAADGGLDCYQYQHQHKKECKTTTTTTPATTTPATTTPTTTVAQTTTTVAQTTTTIAQTTTTVAPTTTAGPTTTAPVTTVGITTVITEPPTPTTVPVHRLPDTGGDNLVLALVALAATIGGIWVIYTARRPTRR